MGQRAGAAGAGDRLAVIAAVLRAAARSRLPDVVGDHRLPGHARQHRRHFAEERTAHRRHGRRRVDRGLRLSLFAQDHLALAAALFVSVTYALYRSFRSPYPYAWLLVGITLGVVLMSTIADPRLRPPRRRLPRRRDRRRRAGDLGRRLSAVASVGPGRRQGDPDPPRRLAPAGAVAPRSRPDSAWSSCCCSTTGSIFRAGQRQRLDHPDRRPDCPGRSSSRLPQADRLHRRRRDRAAADRPGHRRGGTAAVLAVRPGDRSRLFRLRWTCRRLCRSPGRHHLPVDPDGGTGAGTEPGRTDRPVRRIGWFKCVVWRLTL